MISYIKGIIAKKGTDYLIIENNGIGFYINTSFTTLKSVSEGDEACIHTYMHIREDILAIYGFLKTDELEMFKKLIAVSGVGPKAGLSVLSTYDINNIKLAILRDDTTKMSKVPGVGKKTAGKIILELKDKVGKLEELENVANHDTVEPYENYEDNDVSDIVKVLMTLGFNQIEAKRALENINTEGKSENQIIKEALKNINR